MKHLLTVVLVAVVLLSPAFVNFARAEDAGAGTTTCEKAVSEKQKPEPIEMTFTGKITKEERQDKEGKTRAHFILTDAAGTRVMLSGGWKHGDEKAASVNLEEYVNKDVTVTGKGFQRERDGKKWTRMVAITKIDVVVATPPAAK